MSLRSALPLVATMLLALGAQARADEPAATTAPATSAPSPASTGKQSPTTAQESSARVHASHRVDVIAPGEKVETIIDRMRGERGAAARPRTDAEVQTGPGRGPDHLRGPLDRMQGPGSLAPGPGGMMGPPRGDAPPPDRPHR